MTLTYRVVVEDAEKPTPIENRAIIDAGKWGVVTCSTLVFVDGYSVHLPLVAKH